MRRLTLVALALATSGSAVYAQGSGTRVSARLEAEHEVPAISSPATGTFNAFIDTRDELVTYELTYGGLEGAVTQSHIHLAQPGVNGGIMVWLCKTAATVANAPAGTPDCPEPGGSVSGEFGPEDVIGGASPQGVTPGEFDAVIQAIRDGVAYVNVHSTKWPGGEIRGQVRQGGS